MTNRRQFLQSSLACSLLPSILSVAAPLTAQGARRGNEPVVVETPWGQRVVPTLDTYVDIQTYLQLRPGQAWAEGAALGRRLREDYGAGRLKLRRYPWRVAEDVFVLGQAEMEQQIYLIDTGQGLLLIDPSLDAWQDELIEQIRQLGFAPAQVKWVLLTHCHIDHGQSCYLWRKRGARIFAGEGDAHPIESCNSLVATWVETQAGGHCTPCPVDQGVQDGDILQFGGLTVHAIATPGHTPGSTCYYFERDDKGFLVSGDIALHNGRHAWMGNPYADWGQYLDSLGKLVNFALDGKPIRFDVLLPGHGTVDLEQAYRSVDETVRIVRSIVARRAAGEKVDWIEPYPWNWNQGIVYSKGST